MNKNSIAQLTIDDIKDIFGDGKMRVERTQLIHDIREDPRARHKTYQRAQYSKVYRFSILASNTGG